MATGHIESLRQAHKIVADVPFDVGEIRKGYADRYLRIDLSANDVRFLPVTQQMKDLWVGGKGFDLWLLLQEINRRTRWDSPENAICMSPGPLAGTTSFPGSGKTLVTSISPITGSIMDCNVGGFFGPLFKFCGADALVIVGKAAEETIVVIDAVGGRITIERAPRESIDAHLVAEELTEMYAADDLDKKNVSVVCAGRGADHSRMGVLNFSFYDWRKRTARIKQAGRGGIGGVFRDKKLKALVVRNRGINPAWEVAENKVAHLTTPKIDTMLRDEESRAAIRSAIDKWESSPDHVIDMLRDVQDRFGYVPRTALDEITRATLTPTAYLYHLVTFLEGFDLEPHGAKVIQVCGGTSSHVMGTDKALAAFEAALGIRVGETTADKKFALRLGPCLGACGAAPVVRIDADFYGNVRPEDASALLRRYGATKSGATGGVPQKDSPVAARLLTDAERALVTAEQDALLARSRALLAVCTGKRTPAGSTHATGAKPATRPDASEIMLTGHVARPDSVAIPAGATLREIIEKLGGGMRDGRSFKAAQIGGPSGWMLSSASLDQPVDLRALTATGSMTGPDRLIVMDDSTCVVDVAHQMARYLLAQSCGKCTPCREGLAAAVRALARLSAGAGRVEDLAFLDDVCATMHAASACQFGVWAGNPLRSALENFRAEFDEHARDKRCRAGVCVGGV